jgi:Tat protein secretion system quality control protein TatD with DNase activity
MGPIKQMKQIVAMGIYIAVNAHSMKTDEGLAMLKQIPMHKLLL